MGCGSGLDTIITTTTWCALDTTIITITCESASTITIDAKKRRAAERASLRYGAILGALSGFGANGLTVGAVLLPVSAANRVAALVVLVVEDKPLLRCSVAEFSSRGWLYRHREGQR
jgi:hypothetical protein